MKPLGLVPLPAVLRRLGISRPTAYRWIAAGYLPRPVKKMPGKTSPIFFRKDELDAFEATLGSVASRASAGSRVAGAVPARPRAAPRAGGPRRRARTANGSASRRRAAR